MIFELREFQVKLNKFIFDRLTYVEEGERKFVYQKTFVFFFFVLTEALRRGNKKQNVKKKEKPV